MCLIAGSLAILLLSLLILGFWIWERDADNLMTGPIKDNLTYSGCLDSHSPPDSLPPCSNNKPENSNTPLIVSIGNTTSVPMIPLLPCLLKKEPILKDCSWKEPNGTEKNNT